MSLPTAQNHIVKVLEEQIKEVIVGSRNRIFQLINNELLITYWQIGKTL